MTTKAISHFQADHILTRFVFPPLQLFIPRGFAHGFSVLSQEVIFQYKCDNFYAPQSEGALAWDDSDLNINWRIPTNQIILSEKDKHHEKLKDASWLFDYNTNLY